MKFQGAKTYMQNTTVMMMTVTIHTKEAQGHQIFLLVTIIARRTCNVVFNIKRGNDFEFRLFTVKLASQRKGKTKTFLNNEGFGTFQKPRLKLYFDKMNARKGKCKIQTM